jgi:glucosamine-6-phosphate deaminase
MITTTIGETRRIGIDAGRLGGRIIRSAIATHGTATVVLATGTSQFDVLANLVREPDIDWSKVTAFHLDDYIGLPADHRASFRRYLEDRFVAPLRQAPCFIPICDGSAIPTDDLTRLTGLISNRRIDLCFAGIGDNGHLAFNDPPADFETSVPFHVVTLDTACRRQQVDQGWFARLDDVPAQAITMSVRQILKAEHLVMTVPGTRKARVVKATLEGPVTPLMPASIVQTHPSVALFLDHAAAAHLRDTTASSNPAHSALAQS